MARGTTHGEIASELQVSRTSITSDIQYLRNQTKQTIKEYVTEYLPEQYRICLAVLDAIIKRTIDILENSADNKLMMGQKSLNHVQIISMKTFILRMTSFIYAKTILLSIWQ
jgi:predicted DNA-binding protein YlxM (UPF0122 family)